MGGRSRIVLLVVVAAVLALALVLWRRAAPPPGTGHAAAPSPRAPGGVAPRPSARPTTTPPWLGQPGLAARRIAGRVTTERGPLAGATVRLFLLPGQFGVGEVTTHEDGRFDLGQRPAAPYFITAQAPDATPTVDTVDLRVPHRAPPADALELRLTPCAARLSGLVRDSTGGVIAGAEVRSLSAVTISDERGGYELCVPRGMVEVYADAGGYGGVAEEVQVWRRARLDLTLGPEVVIAGRVLDAGAPVAGALVRADQTFWSLHRRPFATAISDEEGRFRIAGLAPSIYQVSALHDGRAAERAVALRTSGGAVDDVVLELHAEQVLRGRVLAGDDPVEGAVVRLQMRALVGTPAEAVSQEDGRFAIRHSMRGFASLLVGHREPLEPRLVDTAATGEIVVRVARLGTLSGRVVTASGAPAAGARVSARSPDARAGGSAVTGTDGSFKLEGLEGATYDVAVDAADFGSMSAHRQVAVGAGEDVRDLLFSLDLAGSVAGVVVDPGGAPLAGVVVTFFCPELNDTGTDSTDEAGRFEARGMSGGGTYAANVRNGGARGSLLDAAPGHDLPRVALRDGNSHVEGVRIVVVPAQLEVSGVVLRGGAPAADVVVRADGLRSEMDYHVEATTAADGRFTLAGLRPGRLQLYVMSSERAVETTAGARDVKIELPGLGAIEGTLVGLGGATHVVVGSPEQGPRAAAVVDGRFRADDLEAGRYRVTVSDGGQGDQQSVDVVAGQVATVTLRAGGTGRVEAVVRELRSGAPLAGVACGWSLGRTMPSIAAMTAADGRCALDVPAGREVRLVAFDGDRFLRAGNDSVTVAKGTKVATSIDLVEVNRDFSDPRFMVDAGGVVVRTGTPEVHVGDRLLDVEGLDVGLFSEHRIEIFLTRRVPGKPYAITLLRDGARLTIEHQNAGR